MFKLLLVSLMALAHREHGAHSHGVGKVSIAFDGKKGKIELEVPAESIYGFEHEARSAKDKKRKNDALEKLEKRIGDMIVFNADLKCEIKKDIFEVEQQERHAEIEAEFSVTCQEAAAGTTVVFNIQKVFPRFKEAQVEVLVDSVQKSLKVEKSGTELELK